jgi:hypothetical protein
MPHYKESDAMNPYEHVIASLAVRVAANELGIEEPKFRFVQNTIKSLSDYETRGRIAGLAKASGIEILIRSGLDHKTLCSTCFHEVRHARQFQQKSGLSREINERDCQIFEREMMTLIGDPPEHKVLETLIKIANKKGL